jgi:plastocyanin
MNNLNNNKDNTIVTSAMLLSLATIIVIAAGVTTPLTALYLLQSAEAYIDPISNLKTEPKAPTVISGENVYVVWWTDKGTANTNGEVMFRASTDGGATFGNKTNLSNTDTADSIDAEISAEGGNVVVTWWERNQTANEPVMRISNDNGETFGPMLRLAANDTLSSEATTTATADTTTATTTTTTTNDDGDDDEATAISISIVRGSSELTDDAYQPNPIEVSIDDTVTWTNDDIAQHTVTSGESGEPDGEFDSGIMSTGATFDHTFTEAGEYPYFCTLHPNMVGTVSVS